MNYKKIAMILSPNMGYLDMGLPLVNSLKENNFNTTLIVPYELIPRGIRVSDTLFKLLNEIIDSYIIVFSDGKTKHIRDLKKFENYLVKIKKLSLFNKKFGLVERLFNNLTYDLSSKKILSSFDLVVFDIGILRRKYLQNVFPYFSKESYWLSYNHEIYTDLDTNSSFEYNNEYKLIYDKTFLLTLNPNDSEYWFSKLDLVEGRTFQVGILRHQKEWISKIQSLDINNDENHILLITRPTNDSFLKKEDKFEALSDILKLQKEFKLGKILIRLHPKETDIKFYFKVFGKSNYKKKWEFTDLHPFIASQRALICFCLSQSNVIYDMNALYIPVIIRKNIKDYNRNYYQRFTEPIVNLGMVTLAQNYNELLKEISKVLANRKNYILKQHCAYKDYFGTPIESECLLKYIEKLR